jgi:CRISPR-associated protein Cas4
MNISVTFLTAYMYCKRKFFLEKIAGISEPPKDVVVKGSIKHDVFDLVNKQERGIVLSISSDDFEETLQKYRNNYAKNLRNIVMIYKEQLKKLDLKLSEVYNELWPLFLEEAESRAKNVHDFLKKHKVFGRELWDKLTPKIESEVFVQSDELQLKGKIDRIEVFENSAIPVELKTGSAPKEGLWEEHMIQLGAYMMLLEMMGKKTPVGKVKYIKENITRELHMNPFLQEEIKKLVKEVQDFLEKKTLPDFSKNRAKCEKCGLREDCFMFQT